MHFNLSNKSKKEVSLFPFVQMSDGDSINLQSKLKEVEVKLNDISTHILLFGDKESKKPPQTGKILKKLLTRKASMSPCKNESLYTRSPLKKLCFKPMRSVDHFPHSLQISPIQKKRFSCGAVESIKDIDTSRNEKSFEIFLQGSPVNKLRKYSSDIQSGNRSSDVSVMFSSKTSFFNRTRESKLQCRGASRDSKYIALENSINEIMTACKEQRKSISMDRQVLPDSEKKGDLTGKFPEIDFIKNICNDAKKKIKPSTGAFIKSGKDKDKYVSMDKNNIFQMYHYADVIKPEQSYNKLMYMTKFGMLKKVCDDKEKVLFVPRCSLKKEIIPRYKNEKNVSQMGSTSRGKIKL
jgi:hypothetical protein